jgi:predicted RNA-binding Zn-ribbon protein involved in translation (DUF1610 family)
MNSEGKMGTDSYINHDKSLASVCGLYCGACGIYLATRENDTDKIVRYAVVLNQTYDETLCDGCRAERKSSHCANMCSFITCAHGKNIEFCGTCTEYPCKGLMDFQSKMPHRIELFESQKRIQEMGWDKWLLEMHESFLCPNCHSVNSAYDMACRKCNNTPSCNFVEIHKELIGNHIAKSSLPK